MFLVAGLASVCLSQFALTGCPALCQGSARSVSDRQSCTDVWPHEPPGFVVVTDYGFSDPIPQTSGDESLPVGCGWGVVFNGYGLAARVTDSAAPASPPFVLQESYPGAGNSYLPNGFPTGGAPGTLFYDHFLGKELYVGFWWKPSNPWQDASTSGVSKIAFLFAQRGHGPMYIMMHGIGSPRQLVVETEFPGDNRNLYPNVHNPDPALGVWHRIEVYARYASGAAGIVKWWMDGVLVGSYADVVFPDDRGFSVFNFSPTFGGTGAPKSENDYFWYDHVHISRPQP